MSDVISFLNGYEGGVRSAEESEEESRQKEKEVTSSSVLFEARFRYNSRHQLDCVTHIFYYLFFFFFI